MSVFQQIVASETARQQRGDQDIQNMFQQFGQAFEQGRQQRQQREAAIQMAEGELKGLQQVGAVSDDEVAGLLEAFASGERKQQTDALANLQGLKGRTAIIQQFEDRELKKRQAEAGIAGTEAGTVATLQDVDIKTPAQQAATRAVQTRQEEFAEFDNHLDSIRSGQAAGNFFNAMGITDEAEQNIITKGIERGDSNDTIFNRLKQQRALTDDPVQKFKMLEAQAKAGKAITDAQLSEADLAFRSEELRQVKDPDSPLNQKKQLELKIAQNNAEKGAMEIKKSIDEAADEKASAFIGLNEAFRDNEEMNDYIDLAIGQATERLTPEMVVKVAKLIPMDGDLVANLLDKRAAGFGSITKMIPGTPAADLASTLLTIQSDAAFSALLAMKEKGGTLGQIAVKELEALQNSRSNLQQSQTPEQLVKNLKKYKEIRSRVLTNMQTKLKQRYGEIPAELSSSFGGGQQAPQSQDFTGTPIEEIPEGSGMFEGKQGTFTRTNRGTMFTDTQGNVYQVD
jgi:hypothetical protein